MTEKCVSCKSTDNVVCHGGISFCQVCVVKIFNSFGEKEKDARTPATPPPPAGISAHQTLPTNTWILEGHPPKPNMTPIRTITVDPEISKHLKPHQNEGVEFLWKTIFSDFNFSTKGDPSTIGGSILAHHMGLGKSLTILTTLHTAIMNPSMAHGYPPTKIVSAVLFIVPANTIVNWQNEVEKWTPDLNCFQLGGVKEGYREQEINKWKRQGGLLFMGDGMFRRMAGYITTSAQPDVLVLDEAHTMLKSDQTQISKLLQAIKTPRVILATGTPLQNNITEFYHMAEFIRPGVFGTTTVKEFEEIYRRSIEKGLPSDSTAEEKLESLKAQVALKGKLDQFVHRKNAEVLLKDLPPIYDNLLYLPPSQIQKRIMNIHRSKQQRGDISKNFFKTYHDLVSMLNHPGCLKLKKGGRGSKLQLKQNGEEWLVVDGIKDSEYRNLEHIRNSPKFILAVHGIAKATELGEKVLISSKCLRTLDMLEHFLSSPDWKSPVGSLRDSFPHLKLGGWKKGKDYVRIDGGVDSGRRGTIIEDFNKETSKTKVFLISSEAGGIEINLCSASVVFILDNHFNPSVSQQCLARVHRYGQTKPVRCYRFAIENSLEAKVYARSENKVSVSKSVLDGFFSEGIFSKGELEDFYASDITETCDKCGKIRILLETQFPSEDDEDWFCAMNQDPKHNSCDIPEEPRAKRVTKRVEKHVDGTADALTTYLLSVHNKATHKKDPIVSSILPVEVKHETGICCNDAIQKLELELGLEVAFDESEREGNQALSSNKIDTSATPQQDHAKPASNNAKKRKSSPEIIVID